jgi:hypothetical protein
MGERIVTWWKVSRWHGYYNYQCLFCPYETVSFEKLSYHVAVLHQSELAPATAVEEETEVLKWQTQ